MSELETMSPTQRLTYVLIFCLTAPSAKKFKKAKKLADCFAVGLTEIQIEGCKSAALQMSERCMLEVST